MIFLFVLVAVTDVRGKLPTQDPRVDRFSCCKTGRTGVYCNCKGKSPRVGGSRKGTKWTVLEIVRPPTERQILEPDLFRPSPTSFTCHGRPSGYYADVETGCRTYHVCDGVSQFTYVCPRRTLFRQESRICDHSYLVRCEGETDAANRDEEILKRLAEFKKMLLRIEDDEDQTQELITTETMSFEEPTGTPTTTIPPTTPSIDTTTQARNTQKPIPEEDTQRQSRYLKFRFKDPRSLFFIPELSNNSVVTAPERELVLTLEGTDTLRFRPRRLSHTFSACPAYCDARYFLPGTCHPCIMIK